MFKENIPTTTLRFSLFLALREMCCKQRHLSISTEEAIFKPFCPQDPRDLRVITSNLPGDHVVIITNHSNLKLSEDILSAHCWAIAYLDSLLSYITFNLTEGQAQHSI